MYEAHSGLQWWLDGVSAAQCSRPVTLGSIPEMAKKKSERSNTPSGEATAQPRRRTTRRTTSNDTPAASADLAGAPAHLVVAPDMRTPATAAAPELGVPSTPTHEEIAEAAYSRYLQRGGSHGYDFDDWLHAERELRLRKP
jgi:hypothetical protein